MSNMEIAKVLHVSVHTVKTHVKTVLAKLSIRSRWQMAATIGPLSPSRSRVPVRETHA
jgi:DNA-binding NarL/FixJ family response regulator